MDMTKKVQQLEDEVKLLKNEVHQTLLDIKDSLASGAYQQPSSSSPAPAEPPTTPRPKFEVSAQEEEPAPRVERQEQEREEGPEMSQAEVRTEEKMDYVPSFVEHRVPREGPGPGRRKADGDGDSRRIDLATLATLGNWADRSARRIGRERVEAILDVYQVTGYLPQNLKEVLLRLLALDNAPVNEEEISLRDCITVLLELNGIVIGHSKTEAAMLSLLVNANGHTKPRGG